MLFKLFDFDSSPSILLKNNVIVLFMFLLLFFPRLNFLLFTFCSLLLEQLFTTLSCVLDLRVLMTGISDEMEDVVLEMERGCCCFT